MRRLLIVFFLVTAFVSGAVAGGVMTNLNQSASYVRMMGRDASIGLDAAFYNPAGLYKLDNGFHISLSNQTILQTRTITTTYPILDQVPKSYEAEVNVPFYPNVYAIYKMDKWAFSFGLTPIGGGGSANFEKGVPSFEYQVAGLVPMLSAALLPLDQQLGAFGLDPQYSNITAYDLNMAFEGSSIYLGFQAGATYEISEKLGVSLGVRYVTASNSYKGSLSGTTITSQAPGFTGTFVPGTALAPGAYMRGVGGEVSYLASTLPDGHPAKATLEATAAGLNAQGAYLDTVTGDLELDVTRSGSGITPIIGIHFSPNDMLDLSFKYEHHTKIELENEGDDGGTGLYPEGEISRGDLPSFISLGAALHPLPRMTIMAGYHWFNDKAAQYGKTDENGDPEDNEDYFDHNGMELSLGVEYGLTEKLYASIGYLYSGGGANDLYQSDLSYSQKSNSIGGGFMYKINDKIGIDLAVGYTSYTDYEKDIVDATFGTFTETYDKQNLFIGVGVNLSF